VRALLLAGALVASLIAPARAETAEEAVGMVLFGQAKTDFVDREHIAFLGRGGMITTSPSVPTRIVITKLGRCRFQVTPRTGHEHNVFVMKDERGTNAGKVLPYVFDFSKVTGFKVLPADVETYGAQPPPAPPAFQVSFSGSGFLATIGADWTPTSSLWAHVTQHPDVDQGVLLKAYESFREKFCPVER
jgi:hypothetical protein